MKIAHLSKPWLPVPSPAYGAIEKMVFELIEEQKATNDIYLFAPGNSVKDNKTKLFSLYTTGQGDIGLDRNTELAQAMHCAIESKRLNVDLIHAHSIDPFLGLSPFLNIPNVFTFYSNPTPANKILTRLAMDHTKFTFLSKSHRKSFNWIENAETIYPGVNIQNFPFEKTKDRYLAFVGTIADKKGILEAVEIAKRTKINLKIAAKIKNEDWEFYEKKVKPYIKPPEVEFLGEVGDKTRNNLLKKALALLFPIKWEEPFGMVMIEAMVVGTPVIAFNRGSVPEVVENGKSGFIVENVLEAVNAIGKLHTIKPGDCRNHVETKFNIKETNNKFSSLYSKILSSSRLNFSIFR